MLAEKIKEIRTKRKEQFERGDPQQLPLLAEEIRLIFAEMKRNIYNLGKRLTEAKECHIHGEFKKWVKDNFEFSYNTANNFMKVYACCLNRPELVQTFSPSVLYKICSRKFPKDLREYLFENGNYLEKIKHKKIKEILQQFKEGELNFKSPKIKALIKFDKGNKRYRRHKKAIEQNIGLLSKLLADFLSVERKIKWPARKRDKMTELTRDQDKEINQILDKFDKVLKKMRPKSKIVDDPKPKLKLVRIDKK